MGGKRKLAKQQERANLLSQAGLRQQAAANRQAQRIAQQAAAADRRFQAEQTRRMSEIEQRSAEALAAMKDKQDVRTDYIEDEEAIRRRRVGGGGGGGGGYGFARPMGSGLGGSPSKLG